jgi:hypothetical protein
MILLRRVGKTFDAVLRVMRSVAGRGRSYAIASLCVALLLFALLAPMVAAVRMVASADRGHRHPDTIPLAIGSMLVNPFLFATGGGASGSAVIEMDATKAGSTDHTDFPLHVVVTVANLKDVAHGGDLSSVNGLAFYTDSGHTALADFERVFHDLTTGSIHYVVRVPSYSHTTNTFIYAQWTSGTTDLSNRTAVWTANNWGDMVKHYNDGTTLSLNDSTSHARNGVGKDNTGATVSLSAGAGKVGGGLSIPSGTKHEFTAVDGSALTAMSYAIWVNPSTNVGTNGFTDWENNNTATPFMLFQNNGGADKRYVDGGYRYDSVSAVFSTGTWYRLGATCSISGGVSTWKFYRNGVQVGTTYTGGTANLANAKNILVGLGFNGWQNGSYDECNLVMGLVHSADWMLADYNSQVAGFYTWT